MGLGEQKEGGLEGEQGLTWSCSCLMHASILRHRQRQVQQHMLSPPHCEYSKLISNFALRFTSNQYRVKVCKARQICGCM